VDYLCNREAHIVLIEQLLRDIHIELQMREFKDIIEEKKSIKKYSIDKRSVLTKMHNFYYFRIYMKIKNAMHVLFPELSRSYLELAYNYHYKEIGSYYSHH
jgi:hypothetical protein